jgi:cytoskeletal protein RodZ
MSLETQSQSSDSTSRKRRKRFSAKKIIVVLVILVLIAGAFWLGIRHNQPTTSNNNSSGLVISTKSPQISKKVTATQPSKSAAEQALTLPPSNGHISLSGTISHLTSTAVTIKTENNQTTTFPITSATLMVGSNGQTIKPSGIKSDEKAAISVFIQPNGTFQVALIRLYN